MDNPDNGQTVDWQAVIAKTLAFLCLHTAELGDKDQATQAKFLLRFGIPRKDIGDMLGITAHSLRGALSRRGKPGKGAGRAKQKQKKA
jgi:hypothetical protein